jgi:hypothetical protein
MEPTKKRKSNNSNRKFKKWPLINRLSRQMHRWKNKNILLMERMSRLSKLNKISNLNFCQRKEAGQKEAKHL